MTMPVVLVAKDVSRKISEPAPAPATVAASTIKPVNVVSPGFDRSRKTICPPRAPAIVPPIAVMSTGR